MKRILSALGLAALCLALASVAVAANVAPSKASQIVTINSGPLCPDGVSVEFNQLQSADGQASLFSIPAGQVLVITSVSLSATAINLASDHFITLYLFRQPSNSPFGTELAFESTLSDASGFGVARFRTNLSPGAVVKSGVKVCLRAQDVTASSPAFGPSGTIYGFLAPDR